MIHLQKSNRHSKLPKWLPASAVFVLVLFTTSCTGSGSVGELSASPEETLRVLAYNIHHGEGMDEKLDLVRIAELIRDHDPDVVALQEIDSVTNRTNHVDQAVELGRLTNMTPVFGRFMAYDGGAYGMALLSRWPIVESRNIRLPDGDEPRTALSAVVKSPQTGQLVRVVGIHFYRTASERMAQTVSLLEQLDATDTERSTPTILAGDFNSEPDSEVMNHLARTWTIVDKGNDHMTFSSFDPTKEIDFVMYKPASQFTVTDQWLVDEPVASDHRPLVVDLLLR